MQWRSHRARTLLRVGVATAVTSMTVLCAPSLASWGTGPVQTQQILSAGTLTAPTGASATNGACVARMSWPVNLSWTATPSIIADGYEVLRSTTAGGPYAVVGTVTDRTTTSFVDASPASNTTYFYVVQAKRNLWRSLSSNEATIKTLRQNCN